MRARGICPGCAERGAILEAFVTDQHAGQIPGAVYAVAAKTQRRRYRVLTADLNAFGPLWHAPRGAEIWEDYEARELAPRTPRYDIAAVTAFVDASPHALSRREREVYQLYWLELHTRQETADRMGIARSSVAYLVKVIRRMATA